MLSTIANIQKGSTITKEKTIEGKIPVVAGGQEPAYFHNQANREANIITVSASGAYSGFINYWTTPIFASDCITIRSKNEAEISTKLIYCFIKSIQSVFFDLQRGQAQPHVYAVDIENVQIPVPPQDIQKKIITEFETVEKKEKAMIEKATELTSQIKSEFSELRYKKVYLGSIAEFKNGLNYSEKSTGDLVTIVGVKDFLEDFSPNLKKLVDVRIDGVLSNSYKLQSGDILVVRSNGSSNLVGRFIYIDKLLKDTSYSGFTIRIRVNTDKINSKFLCYCLRTEKVRNAITEDPKGANIKSINQTMLSSINVPLPPIDEQLKIISRVEKLEKEITQIESELANIDLEKEQILKEHLQ